MSDQPKIILPDDWRKDSKPAAGATGGGAGGGGGAGAKAADAPKLAVDSDWKSQAAAEKQKLAAAEREKAAKSAAAGEKGAGGAGAEKAGPGGRRLPPADFNGLVGVLVTNSLMYMGAFPDESGRAMVSLDHARFHIDLLGVLAEKTKGNITAEEGEELNTMLTELRMRYVEVTQLVAEQIAKQRAGKMGGGGMPGMPGMPGMGGGGGPGGASGMPGMPGVGGMGGMGGFGGDMRFS